MAVEILPTEEGGIFLCNTSMVVFGPVMDSMKEAEEFKDWLEKDPRKYDDGELKTKLQDFRYQRDN